MFCVGFITLTTLPLAPLHLYPTQHSFSTERASGGDGREVLQCLDHTPLVKTKWQTGGSQVHEALLQK